MAASSLRRRTPPSNVVEQSDLAMVVFIARCVTAPSRETAVSFTDGPHVCSTVCDEEVCHPGDVGSERSGARSSGRVAQRLRGEVVYAERQDILARVDQNWHLHVPQTCNCPESFKSSEVKHDHCFFTRKLRCEALQKRGAAPLLENPPSVVADLPSWIKRTAVATSLPSQGQ